MPTYFPPWLGGRVLSKIKKETRGEILERKKRKKKKERKKKERIYSDFMSFSRPFFAK